MVFTPKDHFFYKAKDEGFRARSVYKLKEIQEKFPFIENGQQILDLGAAPGSWSQYLSSEVGKEGKVIAVDLKEMEDIKAENLEIIKADVFSEDLRLLLKDKYGFFDAILSDMAPNTSGIRDKDQWESIELCFRVLRMAKDLLKNKGIMLVKVLEGGDFQKFFAKCKKLFTLCKIVRPEATRSSSKEIYLLCRGFIQRNVRNFCKGK